MTQQNAAQDEDMSMDEILASIRRYVAGDSAPSQAAASQETPHKPKIVQLTASDEWSPPSKMASREVSSNAASQSDSIMSDTARSSTQKAFQKMEQLRDLQGGMQAPSGGKSMDDFMLELLKPLLKQWVDKHLPALVERIVEREIQNALYPSDRS